MAEKIILLTDGSLYIEETTDGIVLLTNGAAVEDALPEVDSGGNVMLVSVMLS